MSGSQVSIGAVSGEHPRGDEREDAAVLSPQALPASSLEVKLPKTPCSAACKLYGEELNRLRMFDFSAAQPPRPEGGVASAYVAFARAVDELKSVIVVEQESLAVDNPRKLSAEQQEFLLKEIKRIAEEKIIGRIAEKNGAPSDENTKERYRDAARVLLENYREIAADKELKHLLPSVIGAFREQHSADLLSLEETCFFGEPNELKQFLGDVQKLKNDTAAHLERFLEGAEVKPLDKSLLQELTPEICARIAAEIDQVAQKAILRRIAELGTEGAPQELLGEFAPYFTHDPQMMTPLSRYADPSLRKEHPELIPGGNDADLAASFLAQVKKLRGIRSDAVCELRQLEEQAQTYYAERQALIKKNLKDQGFLLQNGSEREQPTAVLNEELSLLEVTKRLLGISDVRLVASDHLELIYRANPCLRAAAQSGVPLPPGTLICLSGLPLGEDIRLSCCKQDAATAQMLAHPEGDPQFTLTAQSLLAAATVEKEMAVFRKDAADVAFRLRALDPGDRQTANSVAMAFYELRERLGVIKKSAAELPLEQQRADKLEREFNSQWIEHTYSAGMRALAAKTGGGAASYLFARCQEKVTELAALEQDSKRLLELRKLQAELHLLEAVSYAEAVGRDVFAAFKEGWMQDKPGTPGQEQVDSLLRELQKGYAEAVKCVRQAPEYQANKSAYDALLHETAASYAKHKAEIQGRAGRAASQLFSLGLAASHLLGDAEGEHNRLLSTAYDKKHYANFTEETAERTTAWWGTDKLEVLPAERQESISKKAAALEPEKRHELVSLIEEMQHLALAQGEQGKANALREVLKSISLKCQDPVLETRIAIADAQFTFDLRGSSQEHAIEMLKKARQSAEAIDVTAREKELVELRTKLLSAESTDDRERISSAMAACQQQIAQRELLIKQTYSVELQMHAQRVETGPSALRLTNAKRVSELRSEIEMRERSEMRRANERITALASDLAPDAPSEVRAKASLEKQALEAELAARRSSLVELRIFEAATYLRAGEAMSTKQVLSKLEELREEFKGTPQERTVSEAIASFSKSNDRSQIAAALQQVLHEATQDTLAQNIAWSVGGGAVGAAVFWWGGPPGWAFGYMLGSIAGNLVLKGSNIYAGSDKISQAYKAGMCADGLKESVYAGSSVGLDIITSLAPAGGLSKVGTKGALALASKQLLKTELQKLITDVGSEIGESQLIYLGRRQLLRSALEGTVEFGGSKLMLAGLGLGAAPIAEQVYGIYNASPEQMTAAQKEAALRKIAADASTMVLHMATMAVLENAIVAGGKSAQLELHQLRKNLNDATAAQRTAIEARVLDGITETIGSLKSANETQRVNPLPSATQSSLSLAARPLGAERPAFRPGDSSLLAPEELLGVAKEELSQIVESRRSIAAHPPQVAAAPKGAAYEAAYDWAENRVLINTEIGLSPQRLRELIAHEADHAAQIRAVASAHVQGERLPLCFYDEQGSVNIHPEIIAEVKSRSASPTEFEVRRGMAYAESLNVMLRDRQWGDLASYADAVAERSSVAQEQWMRMQDVHRQLSGIDEEIKNAHQRGATAGEIVHLTERRQLLEEEWTKVHRENIKNIEQLEARLAADEQAQRSSAFRPDRDSGRELEPQVYAGTVAEESVLSARCENLMEKLDAGEVLSVAEQAELLRSARTLANKGETFYLDFLNDAEQKTPGLIEGLELAERLSKSPGELLEMSFEDKRALVQQAFFRFIEGHAQYISALRAKQAADPQLSNEFNVVLLMENEFKGYQVLDSAGISVVISKLNSEQCRMLHDALRPPDGNSRFKGLKKFFTEDHLDKLAKRGGVKEREARAAQAPRFTAKELEVVEAQYADYLRNPDYWKSDGKKAVLLADLERARYADGQRFASVFAPGNKHLAELQKARAKLEDGIKEISRQQAKGKDVGLDGIAKRSKLQAELERAKMLPSLEPSVRLELQAAKAAEEFHLRYKTRFSDAETYDLFARIYNLGLDGVDVGKLERLLGRGEPARVVGYIAQLEELSNLRYDTGTKKPFPAALLETINAESEQLLSREVAEIRAKGDSREEIIFTATAAPGVAAVASKNPPLSQSAPTGVAATPKAPAQKPEPRANEASSTSQGPAEPVPVKPASSPETRGPTIDPGTVVKPASTDELYSRARSDFGKFLDGRSSPTVSMRIALLDLLAEAGRSSEQVKAALSALWKAAPSDKQAILDHAAQLRKELGKVAWNKLEPGTKEKVLTGLDSVEKAGGSPNLVLKGMQSDFNQVLQSLHALGELEQGGGAGSQVLAQRLARALQQQDSNSRGLELVKFDLNRALRQVLSRNDPRMPVLRRLSTGEVQEIAIKDRLIKNGHKAVLASDALRMICEKYGLPIPTGKQIQAEALEEAVDIAILSQPGEDLAGPRLNGGKYPFGEGSYFLAQIKSSTTLAIEHFKYALDRRPSWIPVLMSLPDDVSEISKALRTAAEVGHYPERFKSESADAQALRDVAAQARHALPMRSDAPLWLRAYCGNLEDEAKFVARIKRALAGPS